MVNAFTRNPSVVKSLRRSGKDALPLPPSNPNMSNKPMQHHVASQNYFHLVNIRRKENQFVELGITDAGGIRYSIKGYGSDQTLYRRLLRPTKNGEEWQAVMSFKEALGKHSPFGKAFRDELAYHVGAQGDFALHDLQIYRRMMN